MLTQAATRTVRCASLSELGVATPAQLQAMGATRSEITARLAADRWRRLGRAIVLSNGEPTREQRMYAAVLNCGSRAVLASFSALEVLGLRSWERDAIHVLAPAGVGRPRPCGLPIRLHRSGRVAPDTLLPERRCQRLAPALVLAASDVASPRIACGLLAAAVQQRLTRVDAVRDAVLASPRVRHRHVLLCALDDIAMGAQALSEIDFVRLCRRRGLPPPDQQQVRREPGGRRRYLDASWRLPDGRLLVVEVDGAMHTAARAWFADQLRQNEITLGGALVLRYPSVVVRTEPDLLAAQLRRVLIQAR